ncbi:MAG: MBL fold metallo-hydrolase RNA specificity domain-containing protein [Bacteroidota bacterium]
MQISFFGAARTVTGSKHLITLDDGKNILLDCGMFQGMGKETDPLNRHFGFDPKNIDVLILSHAHIDHSGLIPKLVAEGFKGKIICTRATYDLCEVMLRDSAHIQESDIYHINKKRVKNGLTKLSPIYTEEDVEKSLELFVKEEYLKPVRVFSDVELMFTDVGHILGSAAVHLTITENGKKFQLTFTGDIGRYNTALLNDPEPFPQADIILCESTYGDRLHEKIDDSAQLLLDIILQTCRDKKGKLIIPAFSLGRTQEIVYALNNLDLYGLLPEIKIYVDSPLSVNATDIMRRHISGLNLKVQQTAKNDPDPFGFEKLIYITDKEQSQNLNNFSDPCIIISASGMAEAGRIRHHIMHNVGDAKNTILIVGYAEPNSLGGQLRAGKEQVKIFGDYFDVKAEVKIVDSYSAHGDYEEMIRFLSCQDPKKVKKFFLVHGEYEVQQKFAEKLKQKGFRNIEIPNSSDHYIF